MPKGKKTQLIHPVAQVQGGIRLGEEELPTKLDSTKYGDVEKNNQECFAINAKVKSFLIKEKKIKLHNKIYITADDDNIGYQVYIYKDGRSVNSFKTYNILATPDFNTIKIIS